MFFADAGPHALRCLVYDLRVVSCPFIYKTMNRTERTGKLLFWSIVNNAQVIRDLKHQNESGGIPFASSFDFSTLFTKLPHDVIKQQLYFLTDLLFKNNMGKQYIFVNLKACSEATQFAGVACNYTNNCKETRNFAYLTKEDVKLLVSVNLAETYVRFGETVFSQDKGVAMGAAAGPSIASAVLSVCEYRFLKENEYWSRRLKYVYRYIDDLLCTSVSAAEFGAVTQQIYPPSLPLQKSSGCLTHCDFLDIRIVIAPEFKLHVYDKREFFNFDVVKFIFASSNTNENLGANVFCSQLVRIARICSEFQDFKVNAKSLVDVILDHGFNRAAIIRQFFRFAHSHSRLLQPYGILSPSDVSNLSSDLFS